MRVTGEPPEKRVRPGPWGDDKTAPPLESAPSRPSTKSPVADPRVYRIILEVSPGLWWLLVLLLLGIIWLKA